MALDDSVHAFRLGTFDDLGYLRMAVRAFDERHDAQWLIARRGHKTPPESYAIDRQVAVA